MPGSFRSTLARPRASLSSSLQGASLCKGDIDTYRVELEAFQTLDVALEHPQGQLRMSLYLDPLANPIATKSGNGNITHYTETAQSVYVVVTPKGEPTALTSFDYTLFMDGVAGPDLPVGTPGVFLPEVYQGEDDLVDFAVANTCVDPTSSFLTTVWLSADTTLDEFDLDVATFEVEGVPGKDEVDVSEKVTIPFSTSPGDYHLLVEVDSTNVVTESNEGNNTNTVPVSVAKLCLPDGYEPNDVLGPDAPQAPEVTEDGAADLALCPYEVDWFAVLVPAGKSVEAAINFDNEEGDLDLRLYDPAYSLTLPVKVAASGGSVESETYQPPVGGWVLIRINGFNGGSASYDLDITFQ